MKINFYREITGKLATSLFTYLSETNNQLFIYSGFSEMNSSKILSRT
jgi:hypothetical protein